MRDPYFEFERTLTRILMDDADPATRAALRSELAKARANVSQSDPRYVSAIGRAFRVLPTADTEAAAGALKHANQLEPDWTD